MTCIGKTFFRCKVNFKKLFMIRFVPGTVIGFLPAMAPILRGNMTGEICWFIRMNREYILAITIMGIIPVGLVLILYSVILYRALKKVGELKKATSGSGGTETANNLRYFRGSAVNLREQETTVPLREHSNKSLRCCCWQSEDDTASSSTPASKTHPSKWKAIKVVFLTTFSFVITWVPYFVASTMFVYCDHENNPGFCNSLQVAIASPLAILGFSNSLLNPIVSCYFSLIRNFESNAFCTIRFTLGGTTAFE